MNNDRALASMWLATLVRSFLSPGPYDQYPSQSRLRLRVTGSGLAMHIRILLILPQGPELRMPQVVVGCPLDELKLSHWHGL